MFFKLMNQRKLQEVLFFLHSSVQEKEHLLNNGNKFPMVTFGISKLEGFENVFKSVNAALEVGYRSFECEPRYNQEECLGIVLHDLLPKYNLRRQDVFIIGKIFPKYYGSDTAAEAFLRTCANLNTDYLDLYLMHWPGGYHLEPENEDNLHLRRETWLEMMKLAKKGVIKNIGVCNFDVKHLEHFEALNYVTPAVNQIEFHPRFQQKELMYYCKEKNVLLQAISFENTFHPLLLNDGTVKKVARKLGKSPTQVLLKWILNNGVAVIPQSDKPKAIKSNFQLYNFVLEKPEMDAITAISSREKYLLNPMTVA